MLKNSWLKTINPVCLVVDLANMAIQLILTIKFVEIVLQDVKFVQALHLVLNVLIKKFQQVINKPVELLAIRVNIKMKLMLIINFVKNVVPVVQIVQADKGVLNAISLIQIINIYLSIDLVVKPVAVLENSLMNGQTLLILNVKNVYYQAAFNVLI